MKIRTMESFDKYYGTIKMEIGSPKRDTVATFVTNVDEYKVLIKGAKKEALQVAGMSVPLLIHDVMFSSSKKSMGHSGVENTNIEDTMYVYPTIMKILQLFIRGMATKNHTVYGLACGVAGDNARGSKRKIYEILFNRSKNFGFHRWKKDLLAIPKDLYDRLKEYGLQAPDGNIIFDRELV